MFLNRSSLARIGPAVLVGLLPFKLLDKAILEFQYRLRSSLSPSPRVRTVIIESGYSPLDATLHLKKGGLQHCINLHPIPVSYPDCLNLNLEGRYKLETLEEFAPLIAERINQPLFERFKSRPYQTHFYGPLESLNALSLHDALALASEEKGSLPDVLLLLPQKHEPQVPIDTPIGELYATEIVANIVSNVADGKSLNFSSRSTQFIISFVMATMSAWILYSYPILLTLGLTGAMAAALFLISLLSFEKWNLYLPVAAPLITMLTVYLLGISDRLDQRERSEWEQNYQSDNLKRLEEMRSNFVSLVSHDLKTPIAKIQAMVERLLAGEFGLLGSEQKGMLQKIVATNGSLKRTISALLLLNRVESNEVVLKKEPSDLTALLNEVSKVYEPLAQEKEVTIHCELEPLFLVELDRALIAEVAHNLLDNALKYAPPKSKITLRCGELQNCPELNPPQPGVWFEVQDEGPGIRAADYKQIFKKFSPSSVQSGLSNREGIRGTGLGLYLSAYFVQQHRGHIGFVSKSMTDPQVVDPAQSEYFSPSASGSVFRVSLPLESPAGS